MSYKFLPSLSAIFIILLSFHTASRAERTFESDTLQDGRLNGQVLNTNGAPQPFAAIALFSAPDSSIVQTVLTDTTGKYQFSGIRAGDYYIKVSLLGFALGRSSVIKLGQGETKNVEPIILAISTTTLNVIEVAGRKASVERKGDRFTVNLEKSAMASGSTTDLLKSTPFVSLSATNEVKLQGKKTMILIDSKPIPESSVQEMLQSIPAGNISSVELITNPSSRYDGAYGAVINIITKKKPVEGTTGNIRVEGAQGKYGQYSANGRVTYKKNNVTLFGLAGYNKSDQQSFNGMDRELNASQKPDLLKENITRTFYQHFYSLQTGAEINITDNQTIGFLATGRIVRSTGDFNSSNLFSKLGYSTDSILYTNSPFENKGAACNFNLNYHLSADSGKNELTILSTFTPYRSNFFQSFKSLLVDPSGETIHVPPLYQITNKTDIDIYIAQIDYTHKFNKQWKLETGLKYQHTNSLNNILYEDNAGGQFAKVPEFSNNNHLKELIIGGYLILSKEWKNDKIEAGMRLESTNAEYVGNFSQDYTKLFPTLMYQHTINEYYNFSLSYKKTISRAPYNELVPYTIFINQYTIFTGNPLLKPQYDNIISLNTKVNKLDISFTYTISKGMFGQFPITQDQLTQVTYFATQNLDHATDFHIDLFYPLRITPWWNTQNSGSVFGYTNAKGQVLGQSFNLNSSWFNVKTDQTFELSKKVTLEIVGYYNSSLTSELTSLGDVANIDASLLINVLQAKGQLRIGGTDILKRNVYYSEQNFQIYKSRKDRYMDSRRLTIGFTYNFGRTKIQTPTRKLGNTDALQRIQ